MTQGAIDGGMKRWIWIVIAIGASTAIYFTIRYGLRPKPIPVMNATKFDRSEQIGIVIYKRLRQIVRAERVVLLGSSAGADDDQNVWQGFLKAAVADGEKLAIFNPQDVDGLVFIDKIKADIAAKSLVVVQGLTPDVSHLVAGSLSKKLEKVVGHPVLSLGSLPFIVRAEDYGDLQSQCLDAIENQTPVQRLDCAAQKVARKNLKKKLDPQQIWAVMERHGLKEYLLFIHRP